MARFCLITPHHVSFQPRTLREADELHELGHEVRVVCRHSDPEMRASDLRSADSHGWRLQSVDLCRHGKQHRSWLLEGVKGKVTGQLFSAGVKTISLAAASYIRGFSRLVELASAEPTDWYIAHTQSALPIAGQAARRWGSKLGFDCEDLLSENGTDPSNIVRLIEEKYLPKCSYVTVASKSIGKRLVIDYEIPEPTVLYNAFPRSLAEGLAAPADRLQAKTVRLHWFGQTIGPGRGIEEAMEALNLVRSPVELHLRGRVSETYRSTLLSMIRRPDLVHVTFHALVPHDQLIKTIAEFDIGLALEQPDQVNHSLTVSNKVFSYLLAGVALACTDTAGQREILDAMPTAGFLYPSGEPARLAERIEGWISNREELRSAQQAAWDAARDRFCWDIEREKWLRLLQLSARKEVMVS